MSHQSDASLPGFTHAVSPGKTCTTFPVFHYQDTTEKAEQRFLPLECYWGHCMAADTSFGIQGRTSLHACSGGLLIVLVRYGITRLKLSRQLQGSKYNRKIYGGAKF